jgi:DNA polymerase-1
MGAYGLASRTGISRERAQNFIKTYFQVYPGMKRYMDATLEFARREGYVETYFGRRRYLPEIVSTVPQVKNSAERMAINMPVQGTAADLLKLAMIEIYKQLPKLSPETKMILQVHDELVFEIPDKEVEKVSQKLKEIMENVCELKVPIVAEVGVGDNWGEAK